MLESQSRPLSLTGVFASFVPLDEADDEQDEDDEGDGTHQPYEPALGGDVHLVLTVGCRHARTHTHAHTHTHTHTPTHTQSHSKQSIEWAHAYSGRHCMPLT